MCVWGGIPRNANGVLPAVHMGRCIITVSLVLIREEGNLIWLSCNWITVRYNVCVVWLVHMNASITGCVGYSVTNPENILSRITIDEIHCVMHPP